MSVVCNKGKSPSPQNVKRKKRKTAKKKAHIGNQLLWKSALLILVSKFGKKNNKKTGAAEINVAGLPDQPIPLENLNLLNQIHITNF